MKQLMKWFGGALLGISVGLLVFGCKTTNPFSLTTEQEIEIGNQTALELEKQYGVVGQRADLTRVRNLGKQLIKYCERPELPYQFKILATDEVNALAVPGGHVYVTRGLLAQAKPDDDELAGVLAHEIAHVARGHSAKMIEKSSQVSILLEILTHKSGKSTQALGQLAQNLYLQSYSRDEESEADWYGIGYAYHAGKDPRGLKRFFEELQRLQGGQQPRGVEVYFSSHPQTSDRIKRAEKRAAALLQSKSR